MDKIKENIFPISVGAIAVVLLAMIWFLVWTPLSNLKATETQLDGATKTLEKYGDMEVVPLDQVVERATEQKAVNERDLQEALGFYEQQVAAFNLYFDDRENPPQLAEFTGVFRDRMIERLKQYQSDFEVAVVDQNDPLLGPPLVELSLPSLPQDIPQSMKEYWMFSEILDAGTELELGGLQKIAFPLRGTLEKGQFHQWLQVDVEIDMPYSQLEDLLTALYESDRVLFVLETVRVRTVDSQLNEYLALMRTKNYPNRAAAEDESEQYDAVVPEAVSKIDLSFKVLDWLGPQEETLADEEEDY